MARLRLPLTLRVVFHSLRAAWLGLLLMIIAWLWLVPATPVERSALSAPIGVERPAGLTAMRVARAMVHFAPERAAKMLSDASEGEISPELAGMMLRQVANGDTPQPTQPETTSRMGGGAKFIRPEAPSTTQTTAQP